MNFVLRRIALPMMMVGVATLGMVGSAMPASASCAGPPTIEASIDRAQLVFVGTAVEVTNSDRWAAFALEDIWKGEPGGDRVEVRGGPQPGSASSVDRMYVPGTRYLVFAMPAPTDPRLLASYGDGARWTDNACSATQPYSASLAGTRPASAHVVTPPSSAQQPPGTAAPTTPLARASEGLAGRLNLGWAAAIAAVAAALVAGASAIRIHGARATVRRH